MNIPIDPREGNRRQKALQARLAAMAQNQKAFVGKLGQARGRVRSIGAIGGARGARFPGNGAARPGALNFLQAPGFGLQPGDQWRGGPEMRPSSPVGPPRHVSNPLPSQPLFGPSAQGAPPQGPGLSQAPPQAPTIPDAQLEASLVPAPTPQMDSPDRGEIITAPSGRGAGYTNTAGAMTPKWVPLGGGQYLDPSTGYIYGAGGGILNAPGGRDAAGSQNFKAL